MKYYKIVNRIKNPEYIDKYNELIPDITKHLSQGNVFTDINILNYLDYGDVIYQVVIPEGVTTVEYMPNEFECYYPIQLINPKYIDLKVIDELIQEGANPNICDNSPLCYAAFIGDYDMFQYFHNVCNADLSSRDNYSFMQAKQHMKTSMGHSHIYHYLIEHCPDVLQFIGNDDVIVSNDDTMEPIIWSGTTSCPFIAETDEGILNLLKIIDFVDRKIEKIKKNN
jgi:hypothetical protein